MEFGTPLQVLNPFLALPSLKKIIGRYLEADREYSDYVWPYDNHSSMVTEVEMTDVAVSATHIERFLRAMPDLRSLKWSHLCTGDGACGMWNGGAFVNAVRETVGNRLEQFCLTTYLYDDSLTAVSSFKGLSNLRYLEFSASLLIGPQERGADEQTLIEETNHGLNIPRIAHPEKLYDILPSSLVELRLLLPRKEAEYALMEDIWDGFDLVKQERLPSLTLVTLCCRLEAEVQRMKSDMVKAGVQVVIVEDHNTQAVHTWEGDWIG